MVNLEFLLAQYADDTTVMLDGSESSLNETLRELEFFKNISGLKVNFSKTQVIWIGSKKYSQDSIKTKWKLKWEVNRFKLLGIQFDMDLNKMITINYKDILDKLKIKIQNWQRRHSTPIGKITVIKTLLIPMLNHLFISLPNPPDKIVKELNETFYNFIWNGTDRIKRNVLCQEYIQGGLKMINLDAFITSLKLTWIRRLITDNHKWTKLLGLYTNVDKLLSCGMEFCIKEKKNIHNQFWQDVFKSHIEVITKNQPTDNTQFLSNAIYFNENIKIANKHIFFPKCFDNGIQFINDITKEDGKLMTYQEASNRLNIKINYLQYLSNCMCNAIKAWQNKLKLTNMKEKLMDPIIPHHLQIYLQSRKGTRDMYNILNKSVEEATGKKTWNKLYQFDEKSWRKIFIWPFLVTNDKTLQWFQLRINHHILATNKYLHKIKYIDNPTCTFCAEQVETIHHLLWDCKHTKVLIQDLKSWLADNNIFINITEIPFLFGLYNKSTSIVEQLILLETKYYIFFSRCSKSSLNLTVLKRRLLLYDTNKKSSSF